MRLGVAVCALALAIAACAPAGSVRTSQSSTNAAKPARPAHGDLPSWRLAELAATQQPVVLLPGAGGATFMLDTDRARRLLAVAQRVAAAAGEGEVPEWLLVGTAGVNAFATYHDGRPMIAATVGMVHVLRDDDDAWGALIGHELAHFRLGHHRAQKARRESAEFGSSLASIALSVVGLGVGSVVADATAGLMQRSYSREDERDADRQGLDYLRQAGLDAHGALRLQQKLLALGSEPTFGFLSTHPSGQERVESIRQLLRGDRVEGGATGDDRSR